MVESFKFDMPFGMITIELCETERWGKTRYYLHVRGICDGKEFERVGHLYINRKCANNAVGSLYLWLYVSHPMEVQDWVDGHKAFRQTKHTVLMRRG